MIAARCLGGAERALEVALAYATEREQFGQPSSATRASASSSPTAPWSSPPRAP